MMENNCLLFVLSSALLTLSLSCSTKYTSSAPEGFQIEEGFEMKLIAAEPLITDPVDIEFNEFGDALVLEMPGYPQEDKQSRIISLEDSDGDGIYDKRTVFADNLQLASSILPYQNGVLVAAPPYLLHVKDTDKDKIGDQIDTLMSGFAEGNLQHNYNGLTYGLDNWIYAANGGNSGAPYWYNDKESVMYLRGEDFRFHLESKRMERIGKSSGGYELGVDEWGHIFETHNLHHLSQLVFSGKYLSESTPQNWKSLENISDHDENGLARIYTIGEQESRVNHPEQSGYFSGACGITYYGGGALGIEFDQTVLIADVVLNLIHADKIKSNGAGFSASRRLEKSEFLASTDRSFRPVNMTIGPDGSIYVVDMHRKVIEHPEWIPDEIEQNLDLNDGKDKGRIYQITSYLEDSKPVDFSQLNSPETILSNLGNDNQWIRNTAHRLLMEGSLSENHKAGLNELSAKGNKWSRLHSMWILYAQGELDEARLLVSIRDEEAGIRENALIIAEGFINQSKPIVRIATDLLNDDDQRVRMQAGLSLSRLSEQNFLAHHDKILSSVLAASELPMDEWNIKAFALANKYSPENFAAELLKKDVSLERDQLIIALSGIARNNSHQIAKLLASLSEVKDRNDLKTDVIENLNDATLNGRSESRWIESLEVLEGEGNINLIAATAVLRDKLELPMARAFQSMSKDALSKINNKDLSDQARLDMLKLIEVIPHSQKLDILFQCLDNTEAVSIQEAALTQIASSGNAKVGQTLVSRWATLGPQARRLTGDILLYKKIHHDALLDGLENGTINIGEMNFDLERRRTLLWWTDSEDTKKRAEALFSDAGVVNRDEAIESMRSALALQGSIKEGSTVFQSLCAQCHIYGSFGKDVGPNLTEINRKSKESLLHDILDPNAAVDTRYINHRVETNDGTLHVGMVDSETDEVVIIKKIGGQTVSITKDDIKTFSSLGTSLMMEGLEANMDLQELADLLAFLQNSKA